MTSDDKVTYFAETDARNKRVKFGIKAKDRTKHVYVIGKTGMGKSTLLENMAVQDIQSGEGLAFIDPHGKTAELLLEYIPENRIKDVVYFAPFDVDFPISFNIMEDVGYDKRHLVVSGLMSTFKKIWVDAWSARMEYILSNTLLALLEYPDATLLGVNKMLSDKVYRKKVVDNVTDPAVKSFWVDEFAKYTDKFAAEATPAIQNKIGQFTNNPLIRNIIGQPKSSFDVRELMDSRKILIINLSKGRVGEQNANLLGSMLITKIYLGAMSRADTPDKVMRTLPNFYLYVDEFQSFANESFADILSEARKYKLNLTIAHQYVEQMSDEVRAAVFGNVGTMIVFRVGSIDAEQFEKEFAPKFTADDIVNLGMYQIYLRLMIDGMGSQPFSAVSMPPIPEPPISYKAQVLESSRARYGAMRDKVEEYIRTQMTGVPTAPVPASTPAAPAASSPRSARQDAPQAPLPRREYADRPALRSQEPRRDEPRDARRPEQPKKPLPAPPPEEGGEGFQSLKQFVAPKPQAPRPMPGGDRRPGGPMPRPTEEAKRERIENSKSDLRAALASLVGSTPGAPKPAPAASAAQKPQQAAAPKSPVAPQSQQEAKPKSSAKEVPEDVLKKILDTDN
ncbi:MAG: type IV secretory system conjugative DNA transfer family protein [Candidatus Paceibacterota bacterium]|jgi:energy-coupling factor transporter ATP-binding protein EcfA2